MRPSIYKLTTEHFTTTSCLIHSENKLPDKCGNFIHVYVGSIFSECIKQLVVVKCSVVSLCVDGLNIGDENFSGVSRKKSEHYAWR